MNNLITRHIVRHDAEPIALDTEARKAQWRAAAARRYAKVRLDPTLLALKVDRNRKHRADKRAGIRHRDVESYYGSDGQTASLGLRKSYGVWRSGF